MFGINFFGSKDEPFPIGGTRGTLSSIGLRKKSQIESGV